MFALYDSVEDVPMTAELFRKHSGAHLACEEEVAKAHPSDYSTSHSEKGRR